MATRCRFFQNILCTHPGSIAAATLIFHFHLDHTRWREMDILVQFCIYSACTCTLWFSLVWFQVSSSAFYLIWVISFSPWPTTNQIARLTRPGSEVIRIMAVIKMQSFCGCLEAILTFAISRIRVVLFHLVQQLCIGIITLSAAWMSPHPSMAQNFIGFERQILIAIATKSARQEFVIIDPPHIL